MNLIVSLNTNYKVKVLRNNSKFKGANANVDAFLLNRQKINIVFYGYML